MITIAKLSVLVLTAGLAGRYIFAVLPLSLLSTYGVLKENRPIVYFFGISSILTTIAFAGGYSFLVLSLGILALLAFDGLLWLARRNSYVLSANGALMVNGRKMNEAVLQGKESCILDMENEEKRSNDPEKNKGLEARSKGEDNEDNLQQSSVNVEKERESFDFIAAVCSTWIPSVVGDAGQNIFLKAGGIFHNPDSAQKAEFEIRMYLWKGHILKIVG